MPTDGRITDAAPYGQHVGLYCVNHPKLRWSTKNIAPIGCRSIFFDLFGESREPECSCPASDLRPLVVDDDGR